MPGRRLAPGGGPGSGGRGLPAEPGQRLRQLRRRRPRHAQPVRPGPDRVEPRGHRQPAADQHLPPADLPELRPRLPPLGTVPVRLPPDQSPAAPRHDGARSSAGSSRSRARSRRRPRRRCCSRCTRCGSSRWPGSPAAKTSSRASSSWPRSWRSSVGRAGAGAVRELARPLPARGSLQGHRRRAAGRPRARRLPAAPRPVRGAPCWEKSLFSRSPPSSPRWRSRRAAVSRPRPSRSRTPPANRLHIMGHRLVFYYLSGRLRRRAARGLYPDLVAGPCCATPSSWGGRACGHRSARSPSRRAAPARRSSARVSSCSPSCPR